MISVLMPAFNAEKYIAEAIESIQQQSYTDWQLLIGDDHSTDGTRDVCGQYAERDSRITVVSTIQHHGEANSVRQELLAMAKGEWIHCLDADDTLEPDALHTMWQRAQDTGADAVVQRSVCMTEDGQALEASIPTNKFDYDRLYTGTEACRLTIPGWRINMNGGLFRPHQLLKAEQERKQFVQSQGFKQKLIYDDELLSRFVLKGANIVAVSPAIYYRREAHDSITRLYSVCQLDHLHVQRLVERFAQLWHTDLVGDCELNLWWKIAGYTCEYEYHKGCLSGKERKKVNALIHHYWHTACFEKIRPHLPLWRRMVMTRNYSIFRIFITLRCKLR